LPPVRPGDTPPTQTTQSRTHCPHELLGPAQAVVPAAGEQHAPHRGSAPHAQGGGDPARARVPGRVRPGRGGRRLPQPPAARRVHGGLRVLPPQPWPPRPVRRVPGARQHVRRRAQPPVHGAAARALRSWGGDLPPRCAALHPAGTRSRVLPRRGRARRLLRHRRPARQDQCLRGGHRHPRRQLQPLRPDAVFRRHGRQPVQAPRGRAQRAPCRDGLQRGAHLRGARQEPAPGHAWGLQRAGGVHGDHHAQLLHGQGARHAPAQLPVPHWRRRRAPVHQQPQCSVPARARRADADRRQGRRVPLRVPGGGRPRQRRGQPVQGPDSHRRRRAQGEHHGHRAPGPAGVGAAAVRAVLRGAQGGRQQQDQAVHPRLPHSVRALLHPRGRARGDRRAPAQPEAVGRAGGGVENDAAPFRQHVEQLSVVRACLHRSQGTDAQGRPRVDDRLRLRVQVQQRRLGVHSPAGGSRRAMGLLRPPVPRRRPRRAQALVRPHVHNPAGSSLACAFDRTHTQFHSYTKQIHVNMASHSHILLGAIVSYKYYKYACPIRSLKSLSPNIFREHVAHIGIGLLEASASWNCGTTNSLI
uniref:Uncharacterized protein n=1 Tax=Aegilops tauschii subsp. strangulata TaxID=200361 RepID=A0A452ZW03_AEGTS